LDYLVHTDQTARIGLGGVEENHRSKSYLAGFVYEQFCKTNCFLETIDSWLIDGASHARHYDFNAARSDDGVIHLGNVSWSHVQSFYVYIRNIERDPSLRGVDGQSIRAAQRYLSYLEPIILQMSLKPAQSELWRRLKESDAVKLYFRPWADHAIFPSASNQFSMFRW
jgi:hypothetical protein